MLKLFSLFVLFIAVHSEVTKYTVRDEEGGQDWIIEMKGDVIIDQYREGDLPIKTRADSKPVPWPNGQIPYVIANSYSNQEKQNISNGLNHLSQQVNGCVKFIPRSNQKDYVMIQPTGKGCSALAGKCPRGGMQLISLDKNCLSQHTIIHEASHCLGFDHTQCRMDRDKFVDILTQNIEDGKAYNFEKKATNNELVGFDFESILIYSPKSFSKNGQPTMQPKNPKTSRLYEDEERPQLSKRDIEMIRKLYKCQ